LETRLSWARAMGLRSSKVILVFLSHFMCALVEALEPQKRVFGGIEHTFLDKPQLTGVSFGEAGSLVIDLIDIGN
jgi:hypothetical protein